MGAPGSVVGPACIPGEHAGAQIGERVQIDGSLHHWFEDRDPCCTLIVFIDDATSRLLALRFAEAETTEAYMQTLAPYLGREGRPMAFYSDKHSIFRVNRPDQEGELIPFARALRTLNIEPIHAHSPAGQGARRARQPDATGSAGQGAAVARAVG